MCLPGIFEDIFPFRIVFDRELKLVEIGHELKKLYPDLAIGDPIEKHFKINRPSIPVDFDKIVVRKNSLFLLEILHSHLQLKGQMIYVEHLNIICFLCSPWITEISDLKTFGISLSQFAIHDPVIDFLFLLQAQNAALSDSKQLTDQLTQQREVLRRANQKLKVQYDTTHILTESLTLGEAITKLIGAVCENLGWQVGAFWHIDQTQNFLKCEQVWRVESEALRQFELWLRTIKFSKDQGFPGAAWTQGETTWITDVTQEELFLRKTQVVQSRLHGILELPVKVGSQVVGILEFFSQKTLCPDQGLLEMMTDLSIKIGQFIERKQIEEELSRQNEISETLKSILNSMGDAVIVADENEKFLVFNPAAERMFGDEKAVFSSAYWNQSDSLGKSGKINLLKNEDLPLLRSIRGEEINDLEIFMQCPNEPKNFWVTVTGRPLKDNHGQLKGGVMVCRDITERRSFEEQLLHDAFHDALTGLPNRALFMDRLSHAIALSHCRKNSLCAILFIDLDRFKMVNDSLGHAAGDQLLIAVANRLLASLRSGDTIARLGGDEFAILLEDIENVTFAISIAERVYQELSFPFLLNDQEIFVSASIGIAADDTKNNSAEDFLRDADIAMYQAKRLGKSCYQVFTPTMHIHAVEAFRLETELRLALERQEFRLHYQPIVSLQTGQLDGFEALIRWQHPERGLVSPKDFIPLAEETGLIVPLGRWVLWQACRQMQLWKEKFPVASDLTVSINVSGKQFLQPDFLEQIKHILEKTQLKPRQLKLEMTESILMRNARSVIEILQDLRSLGIQLSIDDFGTGYSSLSYLHRFPINTLKIDRSFIKNIDVNSEELEIVRTVMMLAANLNMSVIAEGIETQEQLAQLKELGCQSGQGYLLSKPVSQESIELILDNEYQFKC